MNKRDQKPVNFEITDKFKSRALELIDESQAIQFAEGLRLNKAVSNVFSREHARMALKYGEDHPRTHEMQVRLEANAEAKTILEARYTDAATPQPKSTEGWVVDGFVRTLAREPLNGVTVAAYDANGRWHESLGHACTDKTGYFSIVAVDLPDKEVPVYIRASKGKKLLESNEVQLVPTRGTADRVEIIIGKRDDGDDCEPPFDEKDKRMPPEGPKDPEKNPKDEEAKKKADLEAERKAREEEKRKLEEEQKKAREEEERKKSLKRN